MKTYTFAEQWNYSDESLQTPFIGEIICFAAKINWAPFEAHQSVVLGTMALPGLERKQDLEAELENLMLN